MGRQWRNKVDLGTDLVTAVEDDASEIIALDFYIVLENYSSKMRLDTNKITLFRRLETNMG